MAMVSRPAFALRTTPTNRHSAPSDGRISASSAPRSMGWGVRYTSAPRDRRQEGDFVTVAQDRSRGDVLAIDGGGRHGREAGEEGHLPGQLGPELLDASALAELAQLFLAADGVAKRS